jgi:hypothetical protein
MLAVAQGMGGRGMGGPGMGGMGGMGGMPPVCSASCQPPAKLLDLA